MAKLGGCHTIVKGLAIPRAIQDQYYAERAAKAQQRRTRPKKRGLLPTFTEDQLNAIAADLRTKPRGEVMHKHGVSSLTLDKLQGEMFLGRYGGI